MGELDEVARKLQQLTAPENVTIEGNRIIVRGPSKPVLEISLGEQDFRLFEQRYPGGFPGVYGTSAFFKDQLAERDMYLWVKRWLNNKHRLSFIGTYLGFTCPLIMFVIDKRPEIAFGRLFT